MKKIRLILLFLCLAVILPSCTIRESRTDKLKDLEFTVVKEEDIPSELMVMIEEKKEYPFKVAYADKTYLYIVEGYGMKATTGYSIQVLESYETQNAIYIRTNLMGPAKDEKVSETETFPFIVIKMEMNEKNVVFK